MLLLSEREYENAIAKKASDAAGYQVMTQPMAEDLFLKARLRETPRDAYVLSFPWGPQALLVWEK